MMIQMTREGGELGKIGEKGKIGNDSKERIEGKERIGKGKQ